MEKFRNQVLEFWPTYLSMHSKKSTQICHTLGLILAYVVVISALVSGEHWYALAAPMVGYFFAFSGHFWFEGNAPAAFGNPVVSFFCDHILAWELLKGNL